MVQPLNYFKETASQTAGPYVHIGCTPNFVGIKGVFEKDLGSGPLYNDKARGERISVRGTHSEHQCRSGKHFFHFIVP